MTVSVKMPRSTQQRRQVVENLLWLQRHGHDGFHLIENHYTYPDDNFSGKPVCRTDLILEAA